MSAGQLTMFEPEGAKLAELVAVYTREANFEEKRAELLMLSGYKSASSMCRSNAACMWSDAAVCEMALQFEQLAGLS